MVKQAVLIVTVLLFFLVVTPLGSMVAAGAVVASGVPVPFLLATGLFLLWTILQF